MPEVTQRKVHHLLRNICKGLEVFSLDELSSAVTKILSKKNTNSQEIIYLHEIACNEFNVSGKSIFFKYSRGESYLCKVSVVVIMFHTLGMTKSDIAKVFKVFPNSITAIFKFYNSLDPKKFKFHAEFKDKHQKVLSKFLTKISTEHHGKI